MSHCQVHFCAYDGSVFNKYYLHFICTDIPQSLQAKSTEKTKWRSICIPLMHNVSTSTYRKEKDDLFLGADIHLHVQLFACYFTL